MCRDTDYPCRRSYGPIRVFFQASCSWRSEGLFGQSFFITPPVQALRGLPCLGSFSVVRHIRHREGPHGWGPARQALKGALWVGSCSLVQCVRHLMGQPLYCSAADAGVWGERLWRWLHPGPVTLQYHLDSMTAWLSSTDISLHNLLRHIPSICLSAVNSSPCPGIPPQSLNSSSHPPRLPGYLHPCRGYVWLRQGLSDSHSI